MCWHLRHIFIYIKADFNVFNGVVLKLISGLRTCKDSLLRQQLPYRVIAPDGKAMPNVGKENDLVATSTHQLLEKILYCHRCMILNTLFTMGERQI